ncbi:MAG: hypothetical protein ACI86X_000885 [Moritella sp.]|jgi:hypothetical protein
MAKLDLKFEKRSAHKFDDDEIDLLVFKRKEQKKLRRETRQRNTEHGASA